MLVTNMVSFYSDGKHKNLMNQVLFVQNLIILIMRVFEFVLIETFGGLEWSQSGRYIVYAAEHPERAKAKRGTIRHGNGNDGDNDISLKDSGYAGVADPRRYDLEDDWGEKFNKKRPAALAVLDTRLEKVSILFDQFVEHGISPGQCIIVGEDGNEKLIFTGYRYDYNFKYRYCVFCQNRP